jgi:micrococcal nuclease
MVYNYNATLIRVVDGDTVDCWIDLGFDIKIKERIRLHGLDAPEVRTKDLDEKRRGFETKEWLISQLESNNGEFTIITDKYNPTGKYGRTIATLFLLDGTNINERMLQEGLATPYK